MEAASEFGYHNNREYTKKFFKKPTAEIDNIFLDQIELNKIHEKSFVQHRTIILKNGLKLSGDILERAKDVFLISSFTGLRISDAKRLRKQNIFTLKGKGYFQIHSQKTSKPLSIPIHPIVQEILIKETEKFLRRCLINISIMH